MRVLVVSQYFWPEHFGINSVVKNLAERGVEVEVLTGKPNYPDGVIPLGYRAWGCLKEEWKGVVIHRVPLIPRKKKSHIALILNYLSFVISGSILGAWMLRKKDYDVVFVYGVSPILSAIPALFITWLKGKKIIIWVQDLWPESLSATGYVKNNYILAAVKQVVKYIYQHTDLLLIQSRAFKEQVSSLASRTPIKYHPNSVDAFFSAQVEIEIPDISGLSGGFSILFAGNIGVAQGVDVIVGAASLLRKQDDIHFVILGDGSCREDMMNLAEKKGLKNIHFPGKFPVEMMPGFMEKASVLLVTLTDESIFSLTVPNKIQAYMAVGKPIIACLNGEGARLIEEAKAGLSTPAEDVSSLAEKIISLYEMSSDELKKMGDNSKHYYQKHFDNNKLTVQLIKHMKSVSSLEL